MRRKKIDFSTSATKWRFCPIFTDTRSFKESTFSNALNNSYGKHKRNHAHDYNIICLRYTTFESVWSHQPPQNLSKNTSLYSSTLYLTFVIKILQRAVFNGVSWNQNQNQSNYNGQSQQTKTIQRTNENSKQSHLTGAKRGKTRATKSRLILVLHLIGWESGARFF